MKGEKVIKRLPSMCLSCGKTLESPNGPCDCDGLPDESELELDALREENAKMSETIAKTALLLYAAHKALKEIAFAPYRSGPDQDIARAALEGR